MGFLISSCLVIGAFSSQTTFAQSAPTITQQPQSQNRLAGTNAAFTVIASGRSPLRYQWSFNGTNLPANFHVGGATNATLIVSNISAANAGNYHVVVTNSRGSVTSSNATLTVLFPLGITSQPTNQTIYAGDAAVFGVSADGSAPLSYQWQFNGANLTGKTNAVLAFVATTNQAGNYLVIVTNAGGSIQSSNAALTVLDTAPVILTQPASQFPNAGSGAMFQINATGSKPLSYQWSFNGNALPGATNSILQLAGVSPAQNGSYQAVVSNRLGTTNSSSATLTAQTVVAWGDNRAGACSPPEELLTNVVAIAGEYYDGVALRADGQWIQWVNGYVYWPWSGLVALSSGSQHTLGVTTSGGIVAWGSNNYGESYPPPVSSNVVAVAGGANHSLALMSDGTVVAWGDDNLGQTNIPAGLSNVTAIASGDSHNLALRADGTVAGWGANASGQANIPAGLGNVTAVACGVSHSLALKADGTVVVWGDNSEGQTNVPAGLSNVVSIASGYNHCLALKADGTVAAWGGDEYGAIEVPAGVSNVMAISAGLAYRCTTLVGRQSPAIIQPPVSATVVVGQACLFDSPAIGTVPLRYQWRFKGTNLPAAMSPALLLTNIGFAQAGAYSLAVSNVLGGATSAIAMLTVVPLEIVSQPASASVVQGTNFSFSVLTYSTQPVSFRWQLNGQNLPDATNSTLVLNSVQTNSAGDYLVVAANAFGSVTSTVATLTVIVPPAFTTQPLGQSSLAGQTVSFTGIADSTVPLTYQWFFNGAQMADTARINGSATSSLSLSNVQASDAGNYALVAANGAGSATSAVAVLNVLLPPAITQSPQTQNVLAGSNFSLTVSVNGNPPPAYQWWFNGTLLADGGRISGSSSNSLTVSLSQTNDTGNYWVTASNGFGMATSSVAAVSVLLPVAITDQPVNQTLLVGNAATFTVGATGFAPPSYLWYSNGVALANGGRISGATSATLAIANVQTNDSGTSYQVVVNNNYGSVTSSVATLAVYAPVQITGQPASEALLLGSNASFTVTATGTAPGYQWYFNGAPMADGGRISGSATPTLSVANVQSGDAGGYVAIVTNLLSATVSRTASLTPLASLAPFVRYVNLNNTSPLSPYLDWSTAATNLQDAVDAAVAGDLILVTNGIYHTGGRVVYPLTTNRVVLDKAVTVQSVNGSGLTVIAGFISAGAPNSNVRCAYLTNGASLIGFTLTNGGTVTFPNAPSLAGGGGAWCEGSSATISNCLLAGNLAVTYGGGAFQGTLFNCMLTNNTGGFGGAAGSNTLINCTLIKNIVSRQNLNSGGGAFGCTLSNCLVVGNVCNGGGGSGGGAYASTLTGCVVSNNTAINGGGVFLGSVNNCLISSNRASAYGGGAYSNALSNCVFTNNFAEFGGAAAYSTLNKCAVIGNRASNYGGGIYFATADNCIFTANFAGSLGTAADGGILRSCTVVSNLTPPTAGIAAVSGSAVTNSIVYDNAGGNIINSKNIAYTCSTLFLFGPVDFTNAPLFVNEAGGDFHLQTNSPCINAGNNSSVTTTTDLDGNPRIVGGTVDIGAYEFQSPASVISYAWLQQYGLPTDGSADFLDSDGDSLNNWQEWKADTNPTNSASALKMLAVTNANPAGLWISWQTSDRTYFVQRSTNLASPASFSTIASNVVVSGPGPGMIWFADPTATNAVPYFYRVGVQ